MPIPVVYSVCLDVVVSLLGLSTYLSIVRVACLRMWLAFGGSVHLALSASSAIGFIPLVFLSTWCCLAAVLRDPPVDGHGTRCDVVNRRPADSSDVHVYSVYCIPTGATRGDGEVRGQHTHRRIEHCRRYTICFRHFCRAMLTFLRTTGAADLHSKVWV